MKHDSWATEESQIGFEILGYLTDHPHSGDTLEGIAQWWLLERKIKHQVANVREALAELVAKGWVLEYKGSDSRIHYRINRRKQGQIQTLLKQKSDDMGCGGSKRSKGRAGS